MPPAIEESYFRCWDFDSTDPANILPGTLWNRRTNIAVQQCPSFEGKPFGTNDPYTGYNYNTSYIGCGLGETTPLGKPHSTPARLSSLRRSTQVALFGDAMCYRNGALVTNKFMRSPLRMTGTDIGDGLFPLARVAGTQGYRHLGRTNVCYLDGHADSVKDRYTQAGSVLAGVATYPANAVAGATTGFLSPDNRAYDGK